ncbi:vitamin D3 receptor-like [Oppia nitens]|uniref:vitamin D3 receptor-like n=1 Tax=Oppia nitens TaxID=1686743 RepID=UPI0023DC5C85|nr:vitamin D3 receptor-like [Oppia nitens]
MGGENESKLCAVCGDRAIGKHFGALACKSCKPFFRRNAIKNKVFKCKTNGNCEINLKTRKSCRKCRLIKCLAVGMKKNNILNEDQRKHRNKLVEENRKKKQIYQLKGKKSNIEIKSNEINHLTNECSSNDSYHIMDGFNDMASPSDVDTNSIKTSDESSSDMYDEYHDSVKIQNIQNNIAIKMLEQMNISNEKFNVIDKNNIEKLRQYYNCGALPMKAIDRSPSNVLTIHEGNRLYELCYISNLFAKPCPRISTLITTNKQLNSIIDQFWEQYIQNVIDFSMNLSSFHDICVNDRIALVKYGCVDIICLRIIDCYKHSEETWNIVLNREQSVIVAMDKLKLIRRDIYNIYKMYFNKIFCECESDIILLDLLTVIIFFNPNRKNLMHPEYVKLEQYTYMYLLYRYLQLKYDSKDVADYKFCRLMKTIDDIYNLGERQMEISCSDNPCHYGPLAREVFDLNSLCGINIKHLRRLS